MRACVRASCVCVCVSTTLSRWSVVLASSRSLLLRRSLSHLVQHPHYDETVLIARRQLAIVFIPVDHHHRPVVTLQGLVHRQVAALLTTLRRAAGRGATKDCKQ